MLVIGLTSSAWPRPVLTQITGLSARRSQSGHGGGWVTVDHATLRSRMHRSSSPTARTSPPAKSCCRRLEGRNVMQRSAGWRIFRARCTQPLAGSGGQGGFAIPRTARLRWSLRRRGNWPTTSLILTGRFPTGGGSPETMSPSLISTFSSSDAWASGRRGAHAISRTSIVIRGRSRAPRQRGVRQIKRALPWKHQPRVQGKRSRYSRCRLWVIRVGRFREPCGARRTATS